MKIFYGGDWPDKINFVDENNVVLGFDMGSCCCEDFGWYIAGKVTADRLDTPDPADVDYGGWVFDPEFFENVQEEEEDGCGGIVAFRITKGDLEAFVHLYNHHNGYYSHCFDLKVGGEEIRSNSL